MKCPALVGIPSARRTQACRGLLIVLAVSLVTLPCLRGQSPGLTDWRAFRGNNGDGTSTDRKVPERWSGEDHILWKTMLPGAGTSTPIIIGQKVFVTCYSGFNVPGQPQGEQSDLKLHVLCLDRANGRIMWKHDVAPRLPEQDTIRDGHGYASSTPTADETRVYVAFGKSGVLALSHAGQELWRTEVGSTLHGWGSGASLLLAGDRLIVNASVESESLIALDVATGKKLWTVPGNKESWNTPILVRHGQTTEIVFAVMGKILSIDPATGKENWSCDTDIPWYMVPSLIAADGVVYALGGRPGSGLAVRLGGAGNVTQTHRLWTSPKGSNVSSPVYHAGYLYWMHDNSGLAYCAEASTGKVVYEEKVSRGNQVYGSPVLADGKIYYPGRSGDVYVVRATPQFELVATNSFGKRGTYNSSPAIAGSQIFLRTDEFVCCIGNK
jgi:outer membrane protein assembly factor BamB